MNEFELEIFEQTSDYAEFRLSGPSGRRSRGLDRAAIDALVGVVEQSYADGSVAQRVFGSTHLRDLGARLFTFLDGDQRWFTEALTDPRGVVVRISAQQRLRHLPWELVAADGRYLAVAEPGALLAVRAASPIASLGATVKAQNRPLRVLFMATSPEGVEPELSYEAEEAGILAATKNRENVGTELVVEESGSLEGLRFTAESYGPGYFDVLHISGHATARSASNGGQPAFVMENELGGRADATADELARAMAGQWPRMVFVSGCSTGNAPAGGTIPSMSESLVKAGAPMVLGWALPVGDLAASQFAAQLYGALAAGRPVADAVVMARRALFTGRHPHWHLLRVYADATPLTAMVTPKISEGRARLRTREAAVEFLDPQTQISRVVSRSGFVGRRRIIQRCLRTLKQPLDAPGSAQALVLHGMGGLGKSTLASRLLERMPTYQRVVWFGRVDHFKLTDLTTKIRFASVDDQKEATKILADEDVDLAVRLRFLLDGPLATIPCLLVFDDFEQGNLDERDGGHVLSPEMAQILPALLHAIRDTDSPTRVVITSRYRFPPLPGATIHTEGMETLTEVEQTKKIAALPNLQPAAHTDPTVRQRAIAAASGNPRLLEWLDKIVTDTALDVDALIAAIENEADKFRRENVFAEKLLAAQPAELQKMLALLNVVELPVPATTVHAVHPHPDVEHHIRRATDLGLLEEGTDPESGQPRYFVSNVLRPLIGPLLTDDEHRHACAAAARSLYQLWVLQSPQPTDTEQQP